MVICGDSGLSWILLHASQMLDNSSIFSSEKTEMTYKRILQVTCNDTRKNSRKTFTILTKLTSLGRLNPRGWSSSWAPETGESWAKSSCRLALGIELSTWKCLHEKKRKTDCPHKFTEAPKHFANITSCLHTIDTGPNLVISGDANLTQSAVRIWNSKNSQKPISAHIWWTFPSSSKARN